MAQRLIYADTLKESMIGACNIFEKHGIDTMIARAVISIIDGIAGVDAVPVRHGRWLTREGVSGAAYCSVCCYELKTNNTNYCPFCGAKMDGGESDGE